METAITFLLSVPRLLCTPKMTRDLNVKAKPSKIVHLSSLGNFSNEKEINSLTQKCIIGKMTSRKNSIHLKISSNGMI